MGATKGREIYAPKSVPAILFGQQFKRNAEHCSALRIHFRQPPDTSTPRISSGSHVTVTSKGRQQTSQSVVNRWSGTLVSMATSDACPQNGQEMDSQTSTRKI
jgi:hypothetical protein